MAKERILILTGRYGDGHLQAARAIVQALKAYAPDVEPILVDFMELVHPIIHPIGRFMFIQGVKKFPSAYGYLYNKTKPDNSYSHLLKKCSRFGLNRLLQALNVLGPSVVISTFPPAASAMSWLRSSRMTNIPSVTLITDHTHHSYWINPSTDHYLVGSLAVMQGLVDSGIPQARITVTGIPVRAEFTRTYNRILLQQKYGLKAGIPTVMVMSGGDGLIEDGPELIKAVTRFPGDLQLLIVCGRNTKLKEQMSQLAAGSPQPMKVFGYVDHVHELMAVSDAIVTKAGGLTISESLAMELPLVLYKPLPGQEEDNTRFLLAHHAARCAASPEELLEIVTHLFRQPEMYRMMLSGCRRLQMKSAAYAVAGQIDQIRREAEFYAIPL